MGLLPNPFKKQKTIFELEDDTEHLQAEDRNAGLELSVAQKREAIARLKERGLTTKHFPDWNSIIKWLKSH